MGCLVKAKHDRNSVFQSIAPNADRRLKRNPDVRRKVYLLVRCGDFRYGRGVRFSESNVSGFRAFQKQG